MEKGPKIRRASLFLALCVATGAAQVEKRPPEVVTLSPASEKSLPMPTFGWDGNAQCDAGGNLYFHASHNPNGSALLRLAPDGTYSTYALSADDAADTWYVAFRAQRDGKLWLLAHGNKSGIFLFEFSRDSSTSPIRTRLGAPENLDVRNFAVLESGHVILHGYYDKEAPKELQGRSYFGEFEASGRLVRSSDTKPELAGLASNIFVQAADAPAAQAEDGSIYMLAGYEVLVISQAAEVLRRFPLKLSDPAYTPSNIYLSSGRLAVAFFKPASEVKDFRAFKLQARYALYDSSNGELLGVYDPTSETGSGLVCYSEEGFTFYRIKGGRVHLITAKP